LRQNPLRRRALRRSVPGVAYERSAAWLLGLEGVALLRALAGDRDYDKAFVDARLAEVRDIVAALDEPPFSRETRTGDIGARQGYEWWAVTYDEPGNPLIAIEEPVVRAVLEQLPNGRAVDVACGTGRITSILAKLGHHVVGVDSSQAMLNRARQRVFAPPASFVLGDLFALPLPPASVDLAVCCLALTHQPDIKVALAQLARVVRPGGHVVTSDIHVASLYLRGITGVRDPQGRMHIMPATRILPSHYLSAASHAGLRAVACAEPAWGVVEGEGGGLAQRYCPDAAASAYRDTPAAIIWHFERCR
jgi:SAM-dependent methyltransferase